MLFIVKSVAAIEQLSALCGEQDAALLVEDAVYASMAQHRAFVGLKGTETFVLKEDLQARGIESRVSPSISEVDFAGFVQLTADHPQSITLN
ncbi:sulfurtransferase complex subunit TusB [Vibrio sp. WXL103]|uniref:sulfurtransferase complex subunit TusB n=1 Tax=unclassified Vibrio TaxID=2614977 RepID=UPI003EC4C5DE